MHHSLKNAIFPLIAVAALTFTACGGGGGGSTSTDLPSDDGVLTTNELMTKASDELAANAGATIVKSLGLSDLGLGASVSKASIDDLCTLFEATEACPDGGTVEVAGYCMPTSTSYNIDAALLYTNCAANGIIAHGRIEATALMTAPSASSVILQFFVKGDATSTDDTSAYLADGINPDVYIDTLEFDITANATDMLTQIFSAASIIDGMGYNCLPDGDSLACSEDASLLVVEPICMAEDEACEPGNDGDEYCAGLGFGGDDVPWIDYGWKCIHGCCEFMKNPATSPCFGLRDCATHEDCRYPNVAMFCIDGFCQHLCTKDGDLRCRRGALCDFDASIDEVDPSSMNLPAEYGVCTCPLEDFNTLLTCDNGLWEPEQGEICDATADGDTGCPAGTTCRTGTCNSCEESACDDDIDNDLDNSTDCDDYDCLQTAPCNEAYCNGGVDIAACCSLDDGTDDDGDGYADCADVDCATADKDCPLFEQCDNGEDDDSDGQVDCKDDDCRLDDLGQPDYVTCPCGFHFRCNEDGIALSDYGDLLETCDLSEGTGSICDTVNGALCCTVPNEELNWRCNDGFDNDEDGATDCADADCLDAPECEPSETKCTDDFDNDGDALIDCADPDCTTSPACSGPR